MPEYERFFHIHGDNIVECCRALDFIVAGLGDLVCNLSGPDTSVTCPVYTVKLAASKLRFQLLPGYGGRRWNQDILDHVKHSGGRLREAADAILTTIDNDRQLPLAAIEFCGALPAGNQAWQRQGRAFSFAHAGIPYFYVAELGGFELGGNRGRRATRIPNPAVPFSFLTITEYAGSICLPVYEANSGATQNTIEAYQPAFGKADFLEFLKCSVLGRPTQHATRNLSKKAISLVKLLANARARHDGLTAERWQSAYDMIVGGASLPDFLNNNAQLGWKKTAYIASLTATARDFMELGARMSFGLTSSSLPLSFVPADNRGVFSDCVRVIYRDIDPTLTNWLANKRTHLIIVWVMGFKPRGDDARPDRGLPPLARMLVGEECDLLTFVYGPAPEAHWIDLGKNPKMLAAKNGLWEAILGVSDGVLIDSATRSPDTPRGYLRESWSAALIAKREALRVKPSVRKMGEQDVDTALHIAFQALGAESVFEGMCNPPGGDWSGISFRWGRRDAEYRWLTLPRISKSGAKRPDHVFAVYKDDSPTVCLCIESKERARALEERIGPRLTRYAKELFRTPPSVVRENNRDGWTVYANTWNSEKLRFIAAGAYLSDAKNPFRGLPAQTALDIQIGVAFSNAGQACTLYMRGDTEIGRALVTHLAGVQGWSTLAAIEVKEGLI